MYTLLETPASQILENLKPQALRHYLEYLYPGKCKELRNLLRRFTGILRHFVVCNKYNQLDAFHYKFKGFKQIMSQELVNAPREEILTQTTKRCVTKDFAQAAYELTLEKGLLAVEEKIFCLQRLIDRLFNPV